MAGLLVVLHWFILFSLIKFVWRTSYIDRMEEHVQNPYILNSVKCCFELSVTFILGVTWVNFFAPPNYEKAGNDGFLRELFGSSKFSTGCRSEFANLRKIHQNPETFYKIMKKTTFLNSVVDGCACGGITD